MTVKRGRKLTGLGSTSRDKMLSVLCTRCSLLDIADGHVLVHEHLPKGSTKGKGPHT